MKTIRPMRLIGPILALALLTGCAFNRQYAATATNGVVTVTSLRPPAASARNRER